MKGKPHKHKAVVMGWIRRVGGSFTLAEASKIWGVDKATMRDWYYLSDCAPRGSLESRAGDLGCSLYMIRMPMNRAANSVRMIRRERKASRRALRTATA